MKKAIKILLAIGAMSTLLALLQFFAFKLYATLSGASMEERRYYDVTFLDCLSIASFYTVPIVILIILVALLLRKVFDVVKYKYIIGIVIATMFFLSLRAASGLLDLRYAPTLIELISIMIFGAILSRVVFKYLPS